MSTPVEQIKDRLSILDVIGGYVELKHAGKSYKGKSPFTNEKTPSFYVSPERGMYYCFSSQQGGDMFTFIEKMEGVDFKGALKILAERAHVELVPEDPKKRDAREVQYALLEEATNYFSNNRNEFPHVQTYIEERGVKEATVHAWRIGYAKDEWRALKQYLLAKGFNEDDMLKAGLVKKAEGKESYDVFRDRIVFPLMDSSGRVVAFSGRALKAEEGVPKYVNSPETELFQKSEILYGYDKAKHGIRQMNFSLVVEGQFDLVLSHQAGYTNTVAVSGTALTKHHIGLLTRISPNVVLALDGDRAGISAVKRIALPMLEGGMDVKVAELPEGADPADVVRKDPKDLKHIVGKAAHVVEFLLHTLKVGTKDERTYKLRVREEILPLLTTIENRIDRDHFEGIIAEYIGATKEGIHFEVERLAEVKKQNPEPPVILEKPKVDEVAPWGQKQALEEHIQALIHVCVLERAWIGERIKKEIETYVGVETASELFGIEPTPNVQALMFRLEEEIEQVKEKQLLEDISHTLTRYINTVAKERLSVISELQKQATLDGDTAKEDALTSRASEVQKLRSISVVIEGEGV